MPEIDTDEQRDEFLESTARVDWKEDPKEVLETVDRLLQGMGLEIGLYDAPSDAYTFKIVARER